ncbi:hypothetical protein, partial [Nocardioides sp.]|uniref:hypothetical protein n=1 Tax=Nocardioides sp. TaxID=35761 RepID=UPI0025DE463F
MAYATGWWFLAGALLVMVIAWNVGVLLWGRGGRSSAPEARPEPLSVQQYLELVAGVEAEHASGTIGGREAHHRLSALARRYLEDSSGRAFSSMTLE